MPLDLSHGNQLCSPSSCIAAIKTIPLKTIKMLQIVENAEMIFFSWMMMDVIIKNAGS